MKEQLEKLGKKIKDKKAAEIEAIKRQEAAIEKINKISSDLDGLKTDASKSGITVDGILTDLKKIKETLDKDTSAPLIKLINQLQNNLEEKIAKIDFSKQSKALVDQILPSFEDLKKQIKELEPVTEVSIKNELSVKKPVWFKQIELPSLIESLRNLLSEFFKKPIKANIDSYQEPEKAIAVRLVDKKGKFLDVPIVVNSGGHGAGSAIPNPLPVSFNASDLQIGAVEIKDGDSETRLDVELDSTKNAIFVQSESLLAALQSIINGTNYLDDISVYTTFISQDVEEIRTDLQVLYNTIGTHNSPAPTTGQMIGGIANGGGVVAAGDFVEAFLSTYGVQHTVFSSSKGDNIVEPIKEASGTISSANVVPAAVFKDASGRGVTPALNASNRIAVDVTAALPAGSATIGSIASILTSIVPGTAATNLGKAVSAAKGATDTGVQMLAIRDDTLSIFSDAENDYEPLHLDATGRLYTTTKITELPDEGQQVMASSISVAVASDQSPIPIRTDKFQQDTFTGTGVGTTVDCTDMAVTYFGILVKGTGGAATTWTVAVEWSIDGTNWTATPLTHTNADLDGVNKSGYSLLTGIRTARYFRANCTALTLGGAATDIVVSVVGMRI